MKSLSLKASSKIELKDIFKELFENNDNVFIFETDLKSKPLKVSSSGGTYCVATAANGWVKSFPPADEVPIYFEPFTFHIPHNETLSGGTYELVVKEMVWTNVMEKMEKLKKAITENYKIYTAFYYVVPIDVTKDEYEGINVKYKIGAWARLKEKK